MSGDQVYGSRTRHYLSQEAALFSGEARLKNVAEAIYEIKKPAQYSRL